MSFLYFQKEVPTCKTWVILRRRIFDPSNQFPVIIIVLWLQLEEENYFIVSACVGIRHVILQIEENDDSRLKSFVNVS